MGRRGEKRSKELLEKRRGASASLYLAEGLGLADKAGSDAITGGGEAVRAVMGPLDWIA
jgi:hypothetical protein